MIERTMGDIILCNTMALQGGHIVMILKIGKPLTMKNNITYELTLPYDVIDRVEQLTDRECAMEDL